MGKRSKGKELSEKKDVIIKISRKLHWSWHVSCGNWQMAGYGDSLEDAEKQALDYVKGITNHGVVQIVHDNLQ